MATFVPEEGNEPPLGRLLAILWVRRGLRDVTQFEVRTPTASIGRDTENDVVLASPAVSSCHARLSLAGGVWTLTDLGSINGTWVDGIRVEESQALALAPGSEVRIAGVVLSFAPRDEWSDSPPPQIGDKPALALSGPLFLPSEDRARWPRRLLIGASLTVVVGLLAYLLLAVR